MAAGGRIDDLGYRLTTHSSHLERSRKVSPEIAGFHGLATLEDRATFGRRGYRTDYSSTRCYDDSRELHQDRMCGEISDGSGSDDDREILQPKKTGVNGVSSPPAKKRRLSPSMDNQTGGKLFHDVAVNFGTKGGDCEGKIHHGLEIDMDEGDSESSDLSSEIDTPIDHYNGRTPIPVQTPQRNFNMLQGCRDIEEFERLNKINEGSYGVVFKARDKSTGEIVALKKVKLEKEREGFPLTALREINVLLSLNHPSIVNVKGVVVDDSLEKVFIMMEYMEHDLKGLMEKMRQPFSEAEVKCLMLQLLEGVKHLHDNWILHRDLKTSNLLFNGDGELKICDFGMARQYGSPLKPYTQLVVTLWYRAPELLLGAKEYSTAVDMWSVGCIMAELLTREPLFNGKSEVDQLDKIFRLLGIPVAEKWPGFTDLPGARANFTKYPFKLHQKFRPTQFFGHPMLSERGLDLLKKLLCYNPKERITADDALSHEWFSEFPFPKSKDTMPRCISKHSMDRG